MAVQTEQSLVTYSGNGSTVTAYPVPFAYLLITDVRVRVKLPNVLEPIVLVEGLDFTLTPNTDGNGNFTGGAITTAVAYDDTHLVFIFREVPLTQLTQFPELGRFPASAIEKGFDKLAQMCQQLRRAMDRCFRVSDFSGALTAPYPQKNTVVGIGADDDIRLFDGPALLSLIQLPGSLVDAPTAYWLNDIDRPLKVPDFIGQLGLQLDDNSLWYSTGLVAGNWTLMALDEDDFASDSPRRFPTQQSVRAWVQSWVNGRLDTELANRVIGPSSALNGHLALFDGDTGKVIKDSGITPANLAPPGAVISYAGTAAPNGWLFCYGQTVSRTTYADLFAAIGSTYGAGDGSTTFALPDLRGRAIAGRDDMGGSAANRLTNSGTGNPGINGATLGASGGADRHVLSINQIPAHNHNMINGSSIMAAVTGSRSQIGGGSNAAFVDLSTVSAGGGEAHPNTQPTLVLNYIIKY